MNSVVIEKKDIDSDKKVILSKEKSKHLLETVKIKSGDSLKITILNEGIGIAVVSSITNESVQLKIESLSKGLSFPITLIIAASRPPTMKKVIEHGTSLGVNEFIIIGADLTEKSYLQSKIYSSGEFNNLTELGISQSVCFFNSPKIQVFKNIFDLPKEIFENKSYILSPYAKKSIIDQELTLESPMNLAIGPERGWSKREVDYFKEKNFLDVSISPSILRVEIATIAMLGLLNTKMKF